MHKAIALLLVFFGVLVVAHRASSQLSTGTFNLTNPNLSFSCGAGYPANMSCQTATVSSCPNTPTIGLTVGTLGPANLADVQGTIVFFTGGNGTAPASQPDYADRFYIVDVVWDTAWEEGATGGSILYAACRPATVLSWVNSAVNSFGNSAMCAQGSSAGSAAIAYSMAWYGAGSYLTDVEFLSGPVLSEIDQGCNYLNTAAQEICAPGTSFCSAGTLSNDALNAWYDPEIYTSNDRTSINSWSGLSGCGTSSGSTNLTTWKDMSIADAPSVGGYSATFYFPGVDKHAWLCSTKNQDCSSSPSGTCPNNSATEGNLFFEAIAGSGDANLIVSGVTGCDGTNGAENVGGGYNPDSPYQQGSSAIETDMNTYCCLPGGTDSSCPN